MQSTGIAILHRKYTRKMGDYGLYFTGDDSTYSKYRIITILLFFQKLTRYYKNRQGKSRG